MQKTLHKKVFCFIDICISLDSITIVPIKKRILVTGSQCINK